MHPHLADLAIDAFLTTKRAQTLTSPVIWFDAYSSRVENAVAGPSSAVKAGKQRSREVPLGDAYEVESDSDSEESSSDETEDEEEEEEDILENDGWRENGNARRDGESQAKTSRYACCHITHNTLHLLVPIRGDCQSPSLAPTCLY